MFKNLSRPSQLLPEAQWQGKQGWSTAQSCAGSCSGSAQETDDRLQHVCRLPLSQMYFDLPLIFDSEVTFALPQPGKAHTWSVTGKEGRLRCNILRYRISRRSGDCSVQKSHLARAFM